jgi:D-arabinose 5-phosphate isomerase GutQ
MYKVLYSAQKENVSIMGKHPINVLDSILNLISSLGNVVFHPNEEFQEFMKSKNLEIITIFSTGVGASAIPSQVLAHSLASVGIRAVAVDPIELLHGGFGRIKNNDIIICFSDSGKTREIRKVLSHAGN